MYLEHFGLAELPFSLTPDTGYFYTGADQQAAVDMLLVALRQGEGFLKLTGEVGLGKTMVCRQLLNSLEEEFVTAYVPNPEITPKAMYVRLAEELGFRVTRPETQERLHRIIVQRLMDIAAEGRRTVLLLDEAQGLPDQTLESVRLLTNLETERFKLLQVVLIGQPELDRRLARSHLRQLRQRVAFAYELRPMTYETFRDYVNHRMRVAGHRGPPAFEERALRTLYRASGGVPRLVNVLCHKALLAAYGPGEPRVHREHALAAIADTEDAAAPGPGSVLALARETGPLVATAALVSLGLAWLVGGLL